MQFVSISKREQAILRRNFFREADWLPGSNHKLIYSESGVAEDKYIFPFFGFGLETWVRYEHKSNDSLAYVRCSENLVIVFRIVLQNNENGTTGIEIIFQFTSLTIEGNNILSQLPRQLPFEKVINSLIIILSTANKSPSTVQRSDLKTYWNYWRNNELRTIREKS